MILDKLKESPNDKCLLIITLIALVGMVLISALLMQPIEQYLKSSTGYGVLDFEFAWNSDTINKIFKAWGENGKQKEAMVTWYDFLFIPAYAFFIFGAILLVSHRLDGKFQDYGIIISLTPLIAGIFDVIENINLLMMLYNDTLISSTSPFTAALCATIKFGLLFIGIIFFFVALIILIINFIKSRK